MQELDSEERGSTDYRFFYQKSIPVSNHWNPIVSWWEGSSSWSFPYSLLTLTNGKKDCFFPHHPMFWNLRKIVRYIIKKSLQVNAPYLEISLSLPLSIFSSLSFSCCRKCWPLILKEIHLELLFLEVYRLRNRGYTTGPSSWSAATKWVSRWDLMQWNEGEDHQEEE